MGPFSACGTEWNKYFDMDGIHGNAIANTVVRESHTVEIIR
jgi:hypothetical protein